jgi:ABC-type polysaccharide/polyol phosphate export permease
MQHVSTLDSVRVNLRVIQALFLREVLTRFGRQNIGFLWIFVEPMIFTLAVAALWSFTRAVHGSDLPIIAFAVTGYSGVLLWRNMPSRTLGAIEPNRPLLYHRNVKVADIFAARLLLEMVGATISFSVLCAVFISLEWMDPPEDLLMVVFAWSMLGWFGAALATLLGALNEESKLVEKLWHPFSYILFPLSGAAFLVSALPQGAQEFVLLLPMVHGAEALRDGYFGSSIQSIYNMWYLFSANMLLTLLGLAKLRQASRDVMVE